MGDGNETLLGRVAVAAKAISQQQLEEAIRAYGRRSDGAKLGEVLVELGYLTPAMLERVVTLQQQVLQKARTKASLTASPAADADKTLVERTGERPISKPSLVPPKTRVAALPDPPTQTMPAEASGPRTVTRIRAVAAKAAAAVLGSKTSPLDDTLRRAAESGVSDIHVHSGAPIRFRRLGQLYDDGQRPLLPHEAEKLLLSVLSDEDRKSFEELGEIDFCYALPEVGRFRANIYRQLRGTDGAFRFIPPEPPTLEQLGLPSMLAKFTTYHQGMVLVTGPTRCGKSSTLAALVNLINEERTEHILTIEDPIEYLHSPKRCLVNQRSARRHTESFARGLRAALREDPDVIVIGELRDRETIGLALSAAETGHFVLATLHTDNAVGTINRLVGAFSPDQQDQVRSMLSESLKAVISQRLLPTLDEREMVPALEVLVVNLAVGNLIREQKTVQIRSMLQTGQSHGMCLLDQSLADLVSEKRVSRDRALRLCEDPKYIPNIQ